MPIQIGRAGSEKILSPREDGRAGAWDTTHEYRDAVAEQPKHIGSNLKMQGDFRKMQGGGHRNLAKSRQISIAWMASSLVKRTGKEQGRPSLPSRVVMNLLANYGQH